MKKFLIYLFFFLPVCISAKEVTTINVTANDNLETLLGDKKYEIDSLVLTGYLRTEDFHILRVCAYKGNLRGLNMENCSVEGDSIPEYGLSGGTGVNGLKYFDFPKNLEKICRFAFYGTPLCAIKLPASLKRIEDNAFRLSGGPKKNVVISEGVVHIGQSAFNSCGIDTLTLPSTLQELGKEAFGSCGIRSVEIKAELHKIEAGVFALNSFEELVLPESINEISIGSFSGLGHLKRLVLPRDLKIIPKINFTSYSELEKIKFPENLETIEDEAFSGTYVGKQLILPDKLQFIGKEVFGYLPKLEMLVLPASLGAVGENAFLNVSSALKAVYTKNPVPPTYTIGAHIPFANLADDAVLYVPVGSLEAYKACSFFSRFKTIKETSTFPTGIENVVARGRSATAKGGDGSITISSDSAKSGYSVFSLDGRKVCNGNVSGIAVVSVGAGTYVVVVDGTKTKVVVR